MQPKNGRPRAIRKSVRAACPLVAALTLLLPAARTTEAQQRDSARSRADSLADRLERAEEAIALLQQQLATQAQSGVQTHSRLSLELTGRVLMSAFGNTRRVNNVDVPLFVRPDTVSGLPLRGGGMSMRQTTLGLALTASEVLGGKFLGDVDVDFFGGQQPSTGGRHFPLLRLRTARAIVKWDRAELLAGQETPLISPLNPVSLASVGTPAFTANGNLWLWLPQLRGRIERGDRVRVGLAGAILAPATGDAAAAFDTDIDNAERSRRPFLESRVHLAWGEDVTAGEIGAGLHQGWFATRGDSLLASTISVVDALIPITSRLELRGEWYRGRGARSLGGGAVGQLLAPTGAPVRSQGGWAQANVRPTSRLLMGVGMGYDDPEDKDLPAAGRQRNQAREVHLHWRPAQPILLGAEYRRMVTRYARGPLSNDHLQLTVGFEF
jgi:hypothetical protein